MFPASALAQKAEIVQMADGSELLHYRMKGSPISSLRVVVRSGSSADPHDKAGLAHLLEHLIFHGDYDTDESALWDELRKSGANVNAFTTADYTYYVLDTPADRFMDVAKMFVRVISGPALTIAALDRERGVVASESVLRDSTAMLWVADQIIFPGAQGGATVIGTRSSRDRIEPKDLVDYYSEHYVPSNITLITVGDLERAEVVQMLEENVRLAPEAPGSTPLPRKGEANVPISEKTSAGFTATLFGYELDGVDRTTCRDLASLVELRVTIAVMAKRPLASDVDASCRTLRGHDFLFAVVISHSYEGGLLPEVLGRTFRDIGVQGPSSKERAIIRQHYAREMDRSTTNARILADALVQEAAVPLQKGARRDLATLFSPPALDERKMHQAAKANFVEKRKAFIHISPFGG
jgi:hypothetical protein